MPLHHPDYPSARRGRLHRELAECPAAANGRRVSGGAHTELDPDRLGLLQERLARRRKRLLDRGPRWARRPMMHLHLHRRRWMMVCHDCRHRPRCGEGVGLSVTAQGGRRWSYGASAGDTRLRVETLWRHLSCRLRSIQVVQLTAGLFAQCGSCDQLNHNTRLAEALARIGKTTERGV